MRSYSGTRLVITARAPPVESTVISAAATGLARPSTETISAMAIFMVFSRAARRHSPPVPYRSIARRVTLGWRLSLLRGTILLPANAADPAQQSQIWEPAADAG